MNIWLVARAFPPETAIGAERPKKFVRYFAAHKHFTTIFTVTNIGGGDTQIFNGALVRRSTPIFSRYFARDEKNVSTFWRRMHLLLAKIVTAIFDDSGWTWMSALRLDLRNALFEGNRPDVIIATGRPFLTFLTVSRFARKHGVPFILDYRDAWSRNPHPSYDIWVRRQFLKWLERHVNNYAFAITTVSQMTAESLNTNKHPLVIYNLPDQGYMDELNAYAPKCDPMSSDKLIIVYSGTLYPGRDLDPICAALSKLDKAIRNRIEVHYCGNSARRAKEAFERYGVLDQLVSHGSLSKSDSTRLVASGDIALSIICSDNNVSNEALKGVITTKVFDYIVLKKDVLNIVPDGFEFRTFANSLNLERLSNYKPDDVAGIADFFLTMLAGKVGGGERVNSDSTSTMITAWDTQMENFNSLLANIQKPD